MGMDYGQFWEIAEHQSDLEIKAAIKQLNHIQTEEVILHLIRVAKQLRAENLELKRLLKKAVIYDSAMFN